MASSRKSPRTRRKTILENQPPKDADSAPAAEDNSMMKEEDKTTRNKKFKKKKQELRRSQRVSLRTRAMGTGLSIDTSKKSSSKQLNFAGNDDVNSVQEEKDDRKDVEKKHNNSNHDDDDDDDDSSVEQVQGGRAREQVMEQLAQERKTKSYQSSLKRKRKQRKEKTTTKASSFLENDDDDDNDDDELFAELDRERQELKEQQQQQQRQQNNKPVHNLPNRHVVFAEDEEDLTTMPVEEASGLQVVVLPMMDKSDNVLFGNQAESNTSTKAMIFSRGSLIDGSDRESRKKRQGKPDTFWKRSKKINRRMLAKAAKQSRNNDEGMAAPIFAFSAVN